MSFVMVFLDAVEDAQEEEDIVKGEIRSRDVFANSNRTFYES